jgi:hypothetical protein
MSDSNDEDRILPPSYGLSLPPEVLAGMLRSADLALQKQLNKNKEDPRLAALEKQWKNMDRFSKRELGPGDVKK